MVIKLFTNVELFIFIYRYSILSSKTQKYFIKN